MKILSKSIPIMFTFDLMILGLSTALWCGVFQFPLNFKMVVTALVAISGLVALFLKSNYKVREFNNTKKNAYLLFEGVVFSQIPAVILLLATMPSLNVLKFLLANTVTIFGFLKFYRIFFHYYLFNFMPVKNVLIIGNNFNARLIADEIIQKQALMMNIVGFLEDAVQGEFIEDKKYKIYKQPVNLSELIKNEKIDIVIAAPEQSFDDKLLSDLIFSLPRRVKLYKMSDMYEMITGKFYVSEQTVNNLFYELINNRSVFYDACKRIFDVVAALIILVVTFPILFYIGLRVKMTDGGAAIYTQNRVGKGGKVFKCYKLRTMYLNDYVPKDEENIKYVHSISADNRIIPFCRVVRKARFDEIPQMINILKGDMSIVGPRAEWVDEVKIFADKIPAYNCRMWVKTGWTGWSHINMPPVFTVDEESERLAYDLYYLRHKNVLWEIGILVKAVFLALGGRHG